MGNRVDLADSVSNIAKSYGSLMERKEVMALQTAAIHIRAAEAEIQRLTEELEKLTRRKER